MVSLWRLLFTVFCDERGEDAPAGGEGDGQGAAPDEGTGASPGAGIDDGTGAGSGDEPPATPTFGEFGDTPKTVEDAIELAKKIYGAHSEIKPEYESLKTIKDKTTATEKNLAALRRTLKMHGIKAIQDEDGNISLEVEKKQPTERKLRFNDDSIGKLSTHFQNDREAAKGFVDLLRLAMQDEAEGFYSERERTSEEKKQQMRVFVQEKEDIEGLMLGYFPSLNEKDESFNKAFHKRATEIWEENYNGHPLKQLQAALKAAQELKVIPQAIAAAEKKGFDKGKTDKKILGPAGQGAGAGRAKGKKLTAEEYKKLSPEDMAAYDKEQVGVK